MDILYLDEIRVAGLGCSKKSLWECIMNCKGHQIGVKLRNQVEFRTRQVPHGRWGYEGILATVLQTFDAKNNKGQARHTESRHPTDTQAQGSGQARHQVLTGHLKPHWNPRPRTDRSP